MAQTSFSLGTVALQDPVKLALAQIDAFGSFGDRQLVVFNTKNHFQTFHLVRAQGYGFCQSWSPFVVEDSKLT
jgi:hypothetical protein